MNNWYECKVTYDKETPQDGKIKKVSEVFLLDAESFTEAEARILKELSDRGPLLIDNLKKVRIAEVFLNNKGDRYYRCKVGFISLDEKAGVEKKKYVQMLVEAPDIEGALENLKNEMHNTLAEYEIAGIAETLILDVFPYQIRYSAYRNSPDAQYEILRKP